MYSEHVHDIYIYIYILFPKSPGTMQVISELVSVFPMGRVDA